MNKSQRMTSILVLAALPLVGAGQRAAGTEEPSVELLPEATLVAVEVRDLAGRWDEMRLAPALTRFLDRLFENSALSAADLPQLAGERAVLGLVPVRGGRSLQPVAVLGFSAASRVEALVAGTDGGLVAHRGRGALWIGPVFHSDHVAALAQGDGTSVAGRLARSDVAQRLPAGGLARGWVNVPALRDFIRAQPPGSAPYLLEVFGASLAAELDAVRFLGFRRDLAPHAVETEMVVGFDLAALPPEVARSLSDSRVAPPLPRRLPAEVLAASSFTAAGDLTMPWLRFTSRSDARGPLRNLEFWIDEFEERSGRQLGADLFELLGPRGWAFALDSESGEIPGGVLVLETGAADRVEETLLALRSWGSKMAFARSLGLVQMRPRKWAREGATIHGFDWWTPLGSASAMAFATADGFLLVGSRAQAVARGLELLADRSWQAQAAIATGDRPPHSTLRVRSATLARIAGIMERSGLFGGCPIPSAVAELAVGLDEIAAEVWYEGDAVRLRGVASFARE